MANVIKKLDLMFIQNRAKVLYEVSSSMSLAQERLEDMLTAIDSNNADYSSGRISKEVYEENDMKMKKESAKLIKKINSSVNESEKIVGKIIKELESQNIKVPKPKKQKPKIKEKIGVKKRKSK